MELNAKQEELKKDLTTLVAKAWTDENFKTQLIKEPRVTAEKLLGKKLNLRDDVELVVNDQAAPSKFYLNIPARPDLDSIELTEEELEMVAGGSDDDLTAGEVAAAVVAGTTIVATELFHGLTGNFFR